MKRLTVWAAASVIVGAVAIPFAFSQDGRSGQPGMGGMHGQQGEHGQKGMMGMMQGCPMMSRTAGASGSAGLIPQLPPGNEKLQAQMQAEIMQKAGEIAAKYTAQAK